MHAQTRFSVLAANTLMCLLLSGAAHHETPPDRHAATQATPSKAPRCESLDPILGDQVNSRLLRCVESEGVKRIAKRSLSPSGDRWVFVGEFAERWTLDRPPLSGQKTDLWLVNIDGTELERLTTNGTSNNPEWEPNECRVFFDDMGSIRTIGTSRCRPSPTAGGAEAQSKDETAVGTIRQAYV